MAKRGEGAKPKLDLKKHIPEIIRRMIEGESLRSICRTEGFPATTTFLGWVAQDEELEKVYRAAVELRADVYFERMLDVAAEQEIGETVKEVDGPDGLKTEITKGDMVQHRRLHIDTIKWALARMNPKKYGDKVDLNHGGRVKVVRLDADDEAI